MLFRSKGDENYYETHKSAFIKYLQPYAKKYIEDNQLEMPPTLKEELNGIFAENDPISSWMNERIEITNDKNNWMTVKELFDKYKADEDYGSNKKDILKTFKEYITKHHKWSEFFVLRHQPMNNETKKQEDKGSCLVGIKYITKPTTNHTTTDEEKRLIDELDK